MKVLYVISVMKNGKGGGHIYSLDHISKQLEKAGVATSIVTIGACEADVFKSSPSYLGNVYFNGINLLSFKSHFRKVVKSAAPDIIHCFDSSCYNVLKSFRVDLKHKLVLNKCGGPNYTYYPISENLIVFSKENELYFRSTSKYAKTNCYLIPNRVNKIVLDRVFDIQKPDRVFSFVRIVRICEIYKDTILKSIRLVQFLENKGYKVQLFVIGILEDMSVYEELKGYSGLANVVFLTDDQYTHGASKMLYLADAVIATGRGFMEASSLGIPVLTIAKNRDCPILITEDNFHHFFEHNFSGRTEIEEAEDSLATVEELIVNNHLYKKSSQIVLDYFENYFDVAKASDMYINVYRRALSENYKVPFHQDLLNKIRTFRSFFIHSRRTLRNLSSN